MQRYTVCISPRSHHRVLAAAAAVGRLSVLQCVLSAGVLTVSRLTANCVAGQVAQRLMGAFVQVPGIPFEKPKKNGKDLIEEGTAVQVRTALIVMRISCAQTRSATNAAFSLCLLSLLVTLPVHVAHLLQHVHCAHSLCANTAPRPCLFTHSQ